MGYVLKFNVNKEINIILFSKQLYFPKGEKVLKSDSNKRESNCLFQFDLLKIFNSVWVYSMASLGVLGWETGRRGQGKVDGKGLSLFLPSTQVLNILN